MQFISKQQPLAGVAVAILSKTGAS